MINPTLANGFLGGKCHSPAVPDPDIVSWSAPGGAPVMVRCLVINLLYILYYVPPSFELVTDSLSDVSCMFVLLAF
jgi:hypothetical protein